MEDASVEGTVIDGMNGRLVEGDPSQPPEGAQQIQYPTIAVMRVPTEPGKEQIQIAELNGIDPLSVPTVLRIAAKIKEQQLGME